MPVRRPSSLRYCTQGATIFCTMCILIFSFSNTINTFTCFICNDNGYNETNSVKPALGLSAMLQLKRTIYIDHDPLIYVMAELDSMLKYLALR